MKKLLVIIFITMAHLTNVEAQLIARIDVKAGKTASANSIVSVALDRVVTAPDSLVLMEIRNGKSVPVICQVEDGAARRLWWQVEGRLEAGATRKYELLKKSPANNTPSGHLKDDKNALTINGLLQYNYETVYPPAGVDTVFRRSGFIHPLWSPNGAQLTNIHPKDHYHHFGIWNPWTDTEFEGENVDFWNLVKKQGTVRFKGFAAKTDGPVWAGFSALQDYVVFKKDQPEKTALHEVLDVKAYNVQAGRRTWDFNSIQSCAGVSPLLLKQYRYGGGFNIRGNGNWNATNSSMITSEGRTRDNADSSNARWIKITGDTEKGRAGLLIMCHPSDFNFPVPLRVWPSKDLQGQVFVCFTPTKTKPWLMEYGRQYVQRYRVVVFDGEMSVKDAEAAWQDYAYPPEVTLRVQ
ncbi:PmoA family protein [uncultured Chitinophaga sp.]|uniref:DUF6807 domain-containing protein n=1 Tax=uncultured Chitinophaga sp. TaxID=339340 RepID=UPI0025EAADD4|nr:PmoA family protein [uncultured Chitinophaga sp.]